MVPAWRPADREGTMMPAWRPADREGTMMPAWRPADRAGGPAGARHVFGLYRAARPLRAVPAAAVGLCGVAAGETDGRRRPALRPPAGICEPGREARHLDPCGIGGRDAGGAPAGPRVAPLLPVAPPDSLDDDGDGPGRGGALRRGRRRGRGDLRAVRSAGGGRARARPDCAGAARAGRDRTVADAAARLPEARRAHAGGEWADLGSVLSPLSPGARIHAAGPGRRRPRLRTDRRLARALHRHRRRPGTGDGDRQSEVRCGSRASRGRGAGRRRGAGR